MEKETLDGIIKGDIIDLKDFPRTAEGHYVLSQADFKTWRENAALDFYDSSEDVQIQGVFHDRKTPSLVIAVQHEADISRDLYQMMWIR